MDGRTGALLQRGHLTCHCLLLETEAGLVLVDTGFGTRDVADPKSRLSTFFLLLVKPAFRNEMTAISQIQSLGFKANDVRHIILTHLDFDHAGGLDDFPHATVHLMDIEREDALAQRSWLDRQRFRPQQWSTRQQWKTYSAAGGEQWLGFDRVRLLDGLPPEIAMIPLPGHTLGHAGVALRQNGKWLLQAGDAYFFHREMDIAAPSCTPGLQFYQWMMEKDRTARLQNQQRLRDLRRSHGDSVDIFCGHDVLEFERLAGRSAEIPAGRLRVI
jgi:glyoxylase-like metal-dependent hydrolase (beta-lactamase superfamily II)